MTTKNSSNQRKTTRRSPGKPLADSKATKKQQKPSGRADTSLAVATPQRVAAVVTRPFRAVHRRIAGLLQRRPHRSFRRTRRRDYVRSLKLPGYWAFTVHVNKTLWRQRKLFILLGVIYAVITTLTIGIASQETYADLTDALREAGAEVLGGDLYKLEEAGLLFLTTVAGGIAQELTEVQQIYALIVGLFAWLTTVWLLRSTLAGHAVRLRDGIYNAGAPIISTALVTLAALVQLMPLALAFIGYAAAAESGLLTGGVEAMLFWIAFALLAALSLYWVTSTFIALVVVTLPGMYPLEAIKVAGDLVVGRRLRILYRLLWMALMVALTWLVIMLPIILIDIWIKGLWDTIYWLPVIPASLLILGTLTIVWVAAYVYLLYRRIVDDDTAPA